MAPQEHPKRSILAIFGPTMSATPQFGDKIGPNLRPYEQHLKPDDARKGYHEPTMSTKPPSKFRIMKAKAKKTPLCPVSLIAIKLKGLAAPGEALKNYDNQGFNFSDVWKIDVFPSEANASLLISEF